MQYNDPCVCIFQIFSGLLVNLDSLGDWIEWAKYISIFSYAMKVTCVLVIHIACVL